LALRCIAVSDECGSFTASAKILCGFQISASPSSSDQFDLVILWLMNRGWRAQETQQASG